MGEFNKLIFRFQKRKDYCFKLLRTPRGCALWESGPCLALFHGALIPIKPMPSASSFYPILKISRKPEPEVLWFLKVSAIKTNPTKPEVMNKIK
jgi:hypothetical protein